MTGPVRGLRAWLAAGLLPVLVAGCTGEPPAPTVPPPTTPAPSSPATSVPQSTSASPGPTPSEEPTASQSRVLATGLDVPWDFAMLPDGTVLITLRERAELVRFTLGNEIKVVAKVDGVVPDGEGGLLGLALSPDFATDSLIYLYYTAADDNRVVRYHYAPDGLGQPKVVVSGIPKAGNHNGGRLRFGPDGMLYIGTGDAGVRENAQDKQSLGGKILRVTPEGGIPSDNPFGNQVWSYGHRNVQGLGWDGEGHLFASEFGQNLFDELNLITRGANYGWPLAEGPSDEKGLTPPLAVWTTAEASPSGIAVSGTGVIFVAALRGERVWRTTWEGGKLTKPEVYFDGVGRIRAVSLIGGELWMLTNNTSRGRPAPDDDKLVAIPA